jgi:hypothetical protein
MEIRKQFNNICPEVCYRYEKINGLLITTDSCKNFTISDSKVLCKKGKGVIMCVEEMGDDSQVKATKFIRYRIGKRGSNAAKKVDEQKGS